jgi:hypothetical protein
MAIQEYTDEINSVSVTATKSAIILDINNEIVDETIEGATTIISPEKIVVGTHAEIADYIIDNNLKYAKVPIPSVEEE